MNAIIVGTLGDAATLALISVGFVVVYRTTRVVSFAQGFFMALGTIVFGTLMNLNFGLWPSLVLAAVAAGISAGLAFWLIFRRLIGVSPFVTAIATIGLGTGALALAEIFQGDRPVILTDPPFGPHKIPFLGLSISTTQLFSLGVAVVVFLAIILTVQLTKLGLQMRAVADQPTLAQYTGVATSRISTLAWAIAGVTAGLAGTTFAIVNQPTPDVVYSLGLAAFPAIILGGFDSITGAVVGSILIALIRVLAVKFLGGVWEDPISYLILLLLLLFRPQGIFGSKEVTRL
jgi:branched-chain amino acid transport system permease protein